MVLFVTLTAHGRDYKKADDMLVVHISRTLEISDPSLAQVVSTISSK